MERYFMTIPEATQLVLQAGTMGAGGEIFILDMGEPVKIVDLARDLIRLSGFAEDEIRIEFSGIRPGEKLFEELATDEEEANRTRHPKILVGRTIAASPADIDHQLDRLVAAAFDGSAVRVRSELRRLVTDYQPPQRDELPAAAVEPPSSPATSTTRITLPPSAVLPARVAGGRASA